MPEILKQIISRYGTSVIEDPGRFASLLNDLRKGEHKREANLLVTALREGVPQHLLSASQGEPVSMLIGRLSTRLVEEAGLADEAARWAVESWALALGLEVAAPELQTSRVPVAELEFVVPPTAEHPAPSRPSPTLEDRPTLDVHTAPPIPTVAEPPARPITPAPPSGSVHVSPVRAPVSRPVATGASQSSGWSCVGCWNLALILYFVIGLIVYYFNR